MKRKPTKPTLTKVPIGTKVRILRPNMWVGRVGVVARYSDEFNIVRVTPAHQVEPTEGFDIGATAEEMEEAK